MYFEIQGTYFKINALYFQTSALCFFFCVEAAKKSMNPGSVFVEKVFVFTCCPYCFFAYCRLHECTFVPCNRNKNSVVVTLIFFCRHNVLHSVLSVVHLRYPNICSSDFPRLKFETPK